MKTYTPIYLFLLLISTSASYAQCFSRNGIMNQACSSFTIITPPAFDVSVGMSNSRILKVDLNYITQDEIVYGGAIGFKSLKAKTALPQIATFNGFLGYNLAGCVIIGCMAGFTRTVNDGVANDQVQTKKSSYKNSIGMSLKFVSTIANVPITVGGYTSNAGIGLTIGTIF